MLVSAKAIYKDGKLIFDDSDNIPEDGAEVVISFVKSYPKKAYSLQDSWAKYFPEDFDSDGHLVGIDIDHASQFVDLYKLEAESLPIKNLSLVTA